MEETNKQATNNPQIISIIAYLTLIGWIIAALVLNKPKQEEASFHIRQALGVNLFFIASGMIFVIPIIGWIAGFAGYLLGFVMWIVGFINAIQQNEKYVPVMGEYFEEWFEAV